MNVQIKNIFLLKIFFVALAVTLAFVYLGILHLFIRQKNYKFTVRFFFLTQLNVKFISSLISILVTIPPQASV